MKKILIVNGSMSYSKLFEELEYVSYHDLFDEQLVPVDLICFTGGEDVSPGYYGAECHPKTHYNPYRDASETMIFNKALMWNIPMVGICRGAQFLNVMSGGEMYQHVEDHCRDHWIKDLESDERILVSSTHHQMMKPSHKGILVASSTLEGERTWWEDGEFKKEVSKEDNEVVYYEHTRSLCFQPHPEFMYSGMTEYFKSLLTRFFN